MSENSPQVKRKYCDDDENSTPVSKLKKVKAVNKNTKESTPKAATPKNAAKSTNAATPKNAIKSTKACTGESSKKTEAPLTSIQNNNALKQTKISFFKVPKDDGNWNIEDFLYENEWKELLRDEFEKDYFKEINESIKPGYKIDNVRPPKELVFNALNSTKLKDIKVVIIGQDPYHDDDQVTLQNTVP